MNINFNRRSVCTFHSVASVMLALVVTNVLFPILCCGQSITPAGGVEFDLERLSRVPKFETASDVPNEGLQAIYYEGVEYRGKPTKVFAYYGLPTKRSTDAEGKAEKIPGVVLVHGGGGTAFANWVKLWNERGYAAIAMDLCGCVPVGTYGKWQRHDAGGPPGWDASFDQVVNEAVADQWQTHAVSAVALANSLICSLPEVDSQRIGLTGISWGGYMTCLVAGVDSRFRCAVPVYGCGYLGDNSAWQPAFERLGQEQATRWLKQWDPSVYLPQARMPFLWVNGTNDFAYPMDSWQRSTELREDSTLCLRIRMPHGHGAAGENPEEIHVFMNSILRAGKPLPTLGTPRQEDSRVTVSFKSEVPIRKAELCYTTDSGKWQERQWEAIEAQLNMVDSSVSAELPEKTTTWYLNLFDERDCVVSTKHQQR